MRTMNNFYDNIQPGPVVPPRGGNSIIFEFYLVNRHNVAYLNISSFYVLVILYNKVQFVNIS